jgi:phosphoribosyl 1,2-cyclic phosphodiesterase
MLTFKALASSSSGCCYRVSGGGSKDDLLIDCGLPGKKLKVALNHQLYKLAGCLISHAHGDHIAGVHELLSGGVECYASRETWLQVFKDAERHHRANIISEREIFSVGEFDVMPFSAVHDMPGTYGFLIKSPENDRLLYLTDSAYCPYKFEGLTQIAIEANFSEEILRDRVESGSLDAKRYQRTFKTHMSIERLIEMLKANDLKQVKEIHLLHLSAGNSHAEGFKRKVQQATGVPVYICDEFAQEVIRA